MAKRIVPEKSLANLKQNPPMGTEAFIEKGKERYGDRYDYTLTEYGDSTDDLVTFRCTIHDQIVTVKARHHLYSKHGGCEKCRGRASSERMKKFNDSRRQSVLVRAQLFLQASMKKFDDKFSYQYLTAQNFEQKCIPLVCLKHDKLFTVHPKSHLYSVLGGCPVCIQKGKFTAGQAGKGIPRKRKCTQPKGKDGKFINREESK